MYRLHYSLFSVWLVCVCDPVCAPRDGRYQGRAEGIFLRYLQRWGKDYLRRRLDWTIEENAIVSAPRHLPTAYCPCQYAEEVMLQKKPKDDPRVCCASVRQLFARVGFQL